MRIDDLLRSARQFALTCIVIILINSERRASGDLHQEPPRFKIGEKVALETTLSCGIGMFENKQDSVTRQCASMNEGESNQSKRLQSEECSACDPLKSTRLDIASVLRAGETSEWESLPKTQNSVLQEINITINFPQVFKVKSISVKAGSTPLPAIWALETSRDFGISYEPIRYYAADQEDCSAYFGVIPIDSDEDEDPICLLKSNSSWEESESDFYSISEISIEGHCMCNGHADECTLTDSGLMACHCRGNTCGDQCQSCCDGYILDNGLCVDEPLTESVSSLPSVSRENFSTMSTAASTLVPTSTTPGQEKDVLNVQNVTTSSEETSTDPSLDSGDEQTTTELTTAKATPTSTSKENASQVASLVDSTDGPLNANQSTSDSEMPIPTMPTPQLTTTQVVDRMVPESTTVKTTSETIVKQVASTQDSPETTIGKDTTTNQTSAESSTPVMPTYTTTVYSATVTSTVDTAASTDRTNATDVTISTVVHATVTSSFLLATEDATTATTTESSAVKTADEFTTVETTTDYNNEQDADLYTTVEATSESTAGERTTVPTPVESTDVETHGESTVPTPDEKTTDYTTEESTAVPIPVESTDVETRGESTVPTPDEQTTDYTTEESTAVPTPEESSTEPTPEESSAVSTYEKSSSVATPEDDTTLSPPEENTTKPIPVETITLSKTEESTLVSTLVGNHTVPTPDQMTAVPTPEEYNSVPTPDENTTESSAEQSTIMLIPGENATVTTLEESTTLPTPAGNTTARYQQERTNLTAPVELSTVSTLELEEGIHSLTTVNTTTVPIRDENTTVTTPEERTSVTIPENNTVTTPEKSITLSTTEDGTSTHTTEENATVPTTVESTTVSTPVEISTVSTPKESSNVSTPDEGITVSIPENTSAVSTPVANTTVSTTEKSATVTMPEENTTVSTPKESTTLAISTRNTTVPTPVKTTAESTAVETTNTDPTPVESTTMGTTEEVTTMKESEENTTSPTPEDNTIVPTTAETTTVPTTVKTTTVPTTVETTSVPTTVTTTTVPTTVETTTVPTTVKTTTVPTTVETTTVPTTVETTTVPTTVETTTVPTTVETTTVPTTVKTTTVPTTVETTTVPTTVETTTWPTTVKSTTVPTTVKTTTVPTTVKTTTVPTTVKTTTVPTTVETTTVPTTVKTTPAPTTSGVLSEEEARKVFGDLPKGVCYCSKFATVDRQCFPTALNKPCICRANFAGKRCERCAPGYFNYPFCASCRCNKQGSAELTCDEDTGRCTCKPGVRGRKCDACPAGSYGFPSCLPCECNPSGSYHGGEICDPYSGQCPCKYGARGRQCNKCPAGYYNFPNCKWCGCNPLTTTANICEDYRGSYKCLCKSNFQGFFCGQCRRGYYDFPICKKCLCSPRGYGSCNQLGTCVCNVGYAGVQCDRCANGYYGFPNCRACNCNTFGSYTKQCNYTTGDCRCRPNIRGIQCDRCDKGMVGFPTCVKCDCNPDGTRFLPGLANNACFGSAKYQCLCKPNVVGRTCDRCMHGFYNFSGSNPLGCTSCSCSPRGTVSGTRNCHVQNGRCDCKNHVIGKKCQNCRDGYHGMKSQDIFGCKACKCDAGGSVSRNCFKHLGDCQCVSGVKGKKCNSLYSSRAIYFPTLYHIFAELEGAVLASNTRIRVPIGAADGVFPHFSGTGYAIFPAYKAYAVAVYIPKKRNYRVIFHYALRDNLRTTAKIELHPRGSKITSHSFEVQFSPSNEQQTKNLRTTVKKRGENREILMEKGVWNVVITSHSSSLLLDYIVFLPEDYYNAGLLQDVPSGPCLLRTSKPEHCDMYTYYELKSPSLVTVAGDRAYTHPLRGHSDIFTDPRYYLDEPHLSNMALLGRNQPTLGFDITVPESGPYLLMVTYLHPERFIQRVFVTVSHQRGMLEILPCKYHFACRQFAMDDNKRPKAFELKATPEVNQVKIESSASAKIGVSSVTAIPQSKWNTQYVKPELLCRMFNKSCISSTYQIPAHATQLVAFSRRDKDKMTSLFNGVVKSSASYYIIVHYRQPNSLSKKVEQISITDYEKRNISVTFHYCPANPGCRIVVGEEENLSFRFSKGIFTATIQHERRTHLSYILLVPKASYTTGLLELQSNGRVNQFLQNCGKDHFFIDPASGRQCREDVFSLSIRFNGEPLKCRCNVLGSRSTVCDEFGGQCLCRPNVVGRRCDRCKLGHSGFPRCRRCGCHEVGSVSQSCSSNGRCRCKPGFGGYKCDRCLSSSYYGFPDCKLCNCNNLGSLSTFCRSRDGQCQCRRNFQGKKCNECRIGFYDFPSCKACNCNPAGIKLLPGQTNGCGSVNNTHCRCKDNVIGDDCDSCKAFHFNLQIDNPLGCQSCDCNLNGTLGSIKTCHETTGQCLCKSHVTGRQCERCKEGYYSLKGPDVFGCKRCSCNVGGSVSPSCNAITGECSCLPGVGGGQCDRVISGDYYYPTLHQYKIELEGALTTANDKSAYFRYDDSEFPGFSWRGYAVFSQAQTSIYIMIDIPRTSKYELIFHYLLARYAPVTALVKFIPTLHSASFPSGPATQQTLDVRFRTTATWIFAIAQFLVVRDNWGDTQQVLLSQGKWKLTIDAPPSDLLLDYMVLLPEEYYRPLNLEMRVSSPCELNGDQKHCAHFAYPSLKQDGFVTIQAEEISVVGGIRRNRRVTDIPFQGLILSGSRNVMSVRLPSKVQGQFVLLASYFHNADDGGILNVVVSTGVETFQAHMSILSCRYRFGCRQVAIDEKHQVRVFTADKNDVTTLRLTTTLTIALDFISAIPLSKWEQQYLVPAEQCISNGYSCIQSAYPTPTDAVRIEAEDRFKGGDRAPYYIMDRRASLKHLKVGEKTVHFSGTAASGRYYVIVHFYQPNFLSFLGKVVISGQNAASTLLTFRYCPHVSGCRATGTSQYREGVSESIYIGRQNSILVSLAIPEDKGVWIDYVLLVPISSFSPSLLDVKPVDVTQDFIQDCGQYTFFLKDSSSKFCLRSAFTVTTRFNSGALKCNCDGLGSTKTSCQSFGGQCICRPNVIGRACDRCRSGYSGFPYCRKLAT